MCGVFGILRTDFMTLGDKEAFSKLSYLSSVRGTDSTGYLSLRKDKGNFHSQILKAALDPIAFSRTIEANRFLERHGFNGLMGHTRYKTKGDVNSDNAHPFRSKCGNYVLFHNGTLTNLHNEYDTDSEWLCNRIADNEGDLSEALCGVHGAYTLILYEEKLRKVSIVRNRERPLWYAHQKDGLVYASEPWMLHAVGVHVGVKELATKWDEHERINVTFDEKGAGVVSFDTLHIRRFSSAYSGFGYGSYRYDKDSTYFKCLNGEIDAEDVLPEPKSEERKETGVLALPGKESSESSGTAGGTGINPDKGKETKKGIGSVEELRPTIDANGDYWNYSDFKEIGYTDQDIKVLMEMEEDFESRIDRDGQERIWVKTTNDFIPYVAYRNALSAGCSYCGKAGPLHLASRKKDWFSRYEFVCIPACDKLSKH